MVVSDFGEGVSGNVCDEIFSWNKINRVIIDEIIVINYVDVFSCGILLWRF